jgi:hypothetical protein
MKMSEPRVDDDVALGLDGYCEFCDMTHDDSDYHANDGEPDEMWGSDD